MGGAPSRETLVRHIVRDPRVERDDAPNSTDGSIPAPLNSHGAASAAAVSQQPEIILIPLIPDYFPSPASTLFQQLLHVRREPTVAYYYRDARSTSTEHTVVHDYIGSDKELYNWYMSLSEQRLLETDNELIALHRAGRVVSPVPCAVAFVHNANVSLPFSVVNASNILAVDDATNTSDGKNGKKGSANRHNKQQLLRRGRNAGGNAGGGAVTGAAAASNSYMTMENTARLPHQNLRVRIFGFVGDTRFCPPSLQPSQAAKLPMCFTIFLSKSAGGNHRAQVTLLAAHTYMTQLRAIGILHRIDASMPAVFNAAGAGSSTAAPIKTHGMHSSAATVPSASVQDGATGRVKSSALLMAATGASHESLDPLASLRGAVCDPYQDPYADPYSTDGGATSPAATAAADPYAILDDSESGDRQSGAQIPRGERSLPHGGSSALLDGLGGASTTTATGAVDIAKEVILRRPLEVVIHRADVPALCYLRELRARIVQNARSASGSPISPAGLPMPSSASLDAATGLLDTDALSEATRRGGPSSLKYLIQTVIRDEELRGSVSAESIGRVLLWASRFYANHFEQLVGGEAAKLRQELAQRNLKENPLEGVLSLAEEEPLPPKAHPAAGDVWITPHDTYMEVCGVREGTATQNEQHSRSHQVPEVDTWKTVRAGTVLRYAMSGARHREAGGVGAAHAAAAGGWHVSPDEFVEDILLSLCRNACQASRRASPADEHWLLNRSTGLPEGLHAGLLIWREVCAGQNVYYGTIPDFLKKWVRSGTEAEAAYRNHVKKLHAPYAESTAPGSTTPPTHDVRGVAFPTPSSSAGGGGGHADAGSRRQSSSVAVTSQSITAAVTTAASKGLYSSYAANSPGTVGGVLNSPQDSSGKEHGKGSGASSLAVYSAHTGFVSTPEQDTAQKLGGKPGSNTAASSSAGAGSTGSKKRSASTRTEDAKARKLRCGQNEDPLNPLTAQDKASTQATASSPVPPPMHSRGSVGSVSSFSSLDENRVCRSLPAHQRSMFAVPVASSESLVRTPNCGAFGSARSNTDLEYVDRLSPLSRASSAAQLQRQVPYPPRQRVASSPHCQISSLNVASACWIGVPDATSHNGVNAPTVNVVVKQRRSVRLTPGSSMLDANVMDDSSPPVRIGQVQSGSNSTFNAASRVAYNNAFLPFSTPSGTPPITVGGTASMAGGGVFGPILPPSVPPTMGSLPIHISGMCGSSSEDDSFHHGGHSPTSVEQSRSLLRTDHALLSHSSARGNEVGRPPQRSAAMDIRPSLSNPGGGCGMLFDTPPGPSSSLKWTTTNAAQSSSMRGASVTFANGSSSTRRQSLLHSSRYAEPSHPLASRPSSVASSSGGLLASSATSSASSMSLRKKEALRPSPLFQGPKATAEVAPETLRRTSVMVQNTPGGVSTPSASSTAPIMLTHGRGAERSGNSSTAHTPRPGELLDAAKSSVGSGKYRWDWRGGASLAS